MRRNYKEKFYDTRNLINKIRRSNRCGDKRNYFKYHCQNTDEHENTKFEIFKKLIKEGFTVYTEAIFESGYRADIVAIKDGVGNIIEIETPKSSLDFLEKKMEEKKENYPSEFYFIEVNTEDFEIDKFEI